MAVTKAEFLEFLLVLLASSRNVNLSVSNPEGLPRDGSNTGPGNQGTACPASLIGQAGTAGVQLSVPRQLKFGAAPLGIV